LVILFNILDYDSVCFRNGITLAVRLALVVSLSTTTT